MEFYSFYKLRLMKQPVLQMKIVVESWGCCLNLQMFQGMTMNVTLIVASGKLVLFTQSLFAFINLPACQAMDCWYIVVLYSANFMPFSCLRVSLPQQSRKCQVSYPYLRFSSVIHMKGHAAVDSLFNFFQKIHFTAVMHVCCLNLMIENLRCYYTDQLQF